VHGTTVKVLRYRAVGIAILPLVTADNTQQQAAALDVSLPLNAADTIDNNTKHRD
jgi:hypothetical protein